jgi:geranylgeranyl diphosphate synthase type I
VSLPIVHALSTAADADELAAIYEYPVSDNLAVDRALEILDDAGSRAYCAAIAAEHHHAALAALDALDTSGSADATAARAQIRAIAESLLGRQA